MVTDVRNKLVNSLSKVSDFNKKTYRFYTIEKLYNEEFDPGSG